MSGISALCAASIAIVGSVVAASADAHAPPEISRIVWNPAGDRVVLVTNRGLIFKDAQNGSWSMMCGAALGAGPVSETEGWDEPDVAYLADGRLFAATTRGLRVTSDGGCAWRAVAPFESAHVSALVQHPSEANTLYVAVSDKEASSIQSSRDGGATWGRALMLANGEVVTRLLFAPTQAMHIYATLAGPSGGMHALLHSSDAGATWKRSALPLRTGERLARLVAVSPRDAQLLLVLVSAAERESQPDRMLVSRDGGESFSELLSSMGLRAAGFGPDGASVWIAGDEALWRSDASLSEPSAVGTAQLVTCVGVHAGALYVCGHHSGFDPPNSGVGLSSDGGGTFQRHMAFTEVTKRVSCAPDSGTARACQADWSDWQLEILVALGGAPIDSVLGDAGLGAAGSQASGAAAAPGADASSTSSPRTSAGTGCGVSRGRGVGWGALLALGLAWLVMLRGAGRRYTSLISFVRSRRQRAPSRPRASSR